MSQVDRKRVKEIFAEALDLDAAWRPTFLCEACGDDPVLRAEVEKLLNAAERPEAILDASNVIRFLLEPEICGQTLSPGERVARFEIVRLIGKGGMGEVYEAHDLHFGDHVALKTIRSDHLMRTDFATRFRREIQLARKVTHSNVCRLYDVGHHEIQGAQVAFLTMELLTGETLSERLKRGPVSVAEGVAIIRQILDGLKALHAAEIIHRDLKPANVLLVPSQQQRTRVVITDFGLAHPFTPISGADTVSVAGQVLGTPAYMSPEQLTGKKVGPESDIYALGIVMYEMFCGCRPFQAEDFLGCAAEKAFHSPERPSRYALLHPRWDSLILSCLDPRADKRPRSAAELLDLLEAAATERERAFRLGRAAMLPPTWRRPAVYALISALPLALLPWQISAVRRPVLRELCTWVPGEAAFCPLPVETGMAVFPFTVVSRDAASNAAAAGLAQYLRTAMERLVPDHGRRCVHLRNDRFADGVGLALECNISADKDRFSIQMAVRQARGDGGAEPLVLRKINLQISRRDSLTLHSEPLRRLANALGVQYDPREWDAWMRSSPKHSDAFSSFLEGLGYFAAGRYDYAVRAFNATTDPAEDFAFAPAQVGLGESYRLLRNMTGDETYAIRARQAYQRAVPLDRDFGFAGAEKHWGELEAGLGNTRAAIDHLSAALALCPYDLQIVKAAVQAYESAGDTAAAERTLGEAVTRNPRCWLTHNTLADFYSRHGRFEKAEKELLEVVRLAPDNANAYHNLSFDYIKTGRLDDAIEMASRSIRLRAMPMFYSTLGRAYLYRSCSAAALVNLRKAVELAPDDFVVWANLAEGLHTADPASAEAQHAYARVVELSAHTLEKSPNYAYARAQHALNLARMGRNEEAAKDAELAIRQGGTSNDIRLIAIETFETAGLRHRALRELEHALKEQLPLRAAQQVAGLADLRRDRAYSRMLEGLQLRSVSDPGGLTLPAGRGCPESAVPGLGLGSL